MKRIGSILLVLLMIIGLAACRDTASPSNNASDQPQWEPSVPETRDLTKLLTADEVTDAVGQPVGEGVLEEHDTVLFFSSADHQTQVSLLLEEPAIEVLSYLDTVTAQYAEGWLAEAPNLGDKAYWCAQTGELLVAAGDELLSINVVSTNMDGEARLLAARQLAALVLERV